MLKSTVVIVFVLALLLAPALGGCSVISDVRTQVCDTLRGAAQSVTDVADSVASSATVKTVGELRAKVKTVRESLEKIRAVTSTVKDGGGVLDVIQALNEIEKATEGMPDNTPISQVADKLVEPVGKVKAAYQSTYDAICAAK
jgi:hypothetical protein